MYIIYKKENNINYFVDEVETLNSFEFEEIDNENLDLLYTMVNDKEIKLFDLRKPKINIKSWEQLKLFKTSISWNKRGYL